MPYALNPKPLMSEASCYLLLYPSRIRVSVCPEGPSHSLVRQKRQVQGLGFLGFRVRVLGHHPKKYPDEASDQVLESKYKHLVHSTRRGGELGLASTVLSGRHAPERPNLTCQAHANRSILATVFKHCLKVKI